MKNIDMQTLIKIALGCVLLFLFSPLIFSIFGIIAKIILWLIIAIVLITTLSIMYIKHKAKKSENGFYSFTYGEKVENQNERNNHAYEKVEDDFDTANVVDVEFEEADSSENHDNEK